VCVERDLEAQELKRHYSSVPAHRDADNVRIEISAELKWLNYRELADSLDDYEDEMAAAQEYETRGP